MRKKKKKGGERKNLAARYNKFYIRDRITDFSRIDNQTWGEEERRDRNLADRFGCIYSQPEVPGGKAKGKRRVLLVDDFPGR